MCVFHKCTMCRKEAVVGSSWVKSSINQTNHKQMLRFWSLNAFFSAAVQLSMNLTIAVCFFENIALWSHVSCICWNYLWASVYWCRWADRVCIWVGDGGGYKQKKTAQICASPILLWLENTKSNFSSVILEEEFLSQSLFLP